MSGARPGIDGAYRIDAVDHDLSSADSVTATLSLKQPHEGAGLDNR